MNKSNYKLDHKKNEDYRKNEVETQVELTWKIMKTVRVTVITVTVKKDSLLVYVLNFFGILAGRCGSVVVRVRD